MWFATTVSNSESGKGREVASHCWILTLGRMDLRAAMSGLELRVATMAGEKSVSVREVTEESWEGEEMAWGDQRAPVPAPTSRMEPLLGMKVWANWNQDWGCVL